MSAVLKLLVLTVEYMADPAQRSPGARTPHRNRKDLAHTLTASRGAKVRQPNFWAMSFVTLLRACVVNQIAGIVGSRFCDGRIG
jgi:hypothetical protein